MTRRDVTRLCIKMLGLLILLSTAASLPFTIYGFELLIKAWVAARVAHDWLSLVVATAYQFGPTAIYGALGLSLMWWSRRAVDRASEAPQDDDLPAASADLKSVEVSLVTVIGLYFLADGFAEFCRFAFSQGFYYSLDGSATLKSIWMDMTGSVVFALLQIIMKLMIGASLALGRGAAVAMLHRARHWVQKWRAWPYQPGEDGKR